MSSDHRRSLLTWTVVLILCALLAWRGSLALRRVALELRYFWWLVAILVGGLWLLLKIGRRSD